MLSYLRGRALNQGFLGGSRVWIGIGIVAWTIRFFQWLDRPETAVVYRDQLKEGQSVTIRHRPAPPTRRQRKKAAEQARRDGRKAAKAARRQARKAPAGGVTGDLPASA